MMREKWIRIVKRLRRFCEKILAAMGGLFAINKDAVCSGIVCCADKKKRCILICMHPTPSPRFELGYPFGN